MTENRRIFCNVTATYARSVYAIVCGLIAGRWVLMALGKTDYGILGLVGGLTAFISFFNSILASANSRFYAYSVGACQTASDKSSALEECRAWFNTAVSVHTVIPFVLIAIGYPIGAYAVEHWLTIPVERVCSALWVFRFVCVSCFVMMVNVPFAAMYTAKQYIAELTIYSFITSTLNVLVLYYMVSHPSQWMTKYAAWNCMCLVIPQIVICIRAYIIFPECRFNRKYLFNKNRLLKLGAYTGWQSFGIFSTMLRTSGMSIVINKFFGVQMNAALAVGDTIRGHVGSLAGSMQGAFLPVIVQAYGAGLHDKMRAFAYRACKFNVICIALFAAPLILELPEIIRLWLKDPPAYAVGLCVCSILFYITDACTVGQVSAINAKGQIARYNAVLCSISYFVLPTAVLVGYIMHNIYAVMVTQIAFEVVNSIGRVLFARKLVCMSARYWLFKIIFPSALVILFCSFVAWTPRFFMEQSFVRVCVTTIIFELCFLPFTWFVLLTEDEREFVLAHIKPKLRKLKGLF